MIGIEYITSVLFIHISFLKIFENFEIWNFIELCKLNNIIMYKNL